VVSSVLLDLTAMALIENASLSIHRLRPGFGRRPLGRCSPPSKRPCLGRATTALYTRFARGRSTRSRKRSLAMRQKFGGHLEKPSGG